MMESERKKTQDFLNKNLKMGHQHTASERGCLRRAPVPTAAASALVNRGDAQTDRAQVYVCNSFSANTAQGGAN